MNSLPLLVNKACAAGFWQPSNLKVSQVHRPHIVQTGSFQNCAKATISTKIGYYFVPLESHLPPPAETKRPMGSQKRRGSQAPISSANHSDQSKVYFFVKVSEGKEAGPSLSFPRGPSTGRWHRVWEWWEGCAFFFLAPFLWPATTSYQFYKNQAYCPTPVGRAPVLPIYSCSASWQRCRSCPVKTSDWWVIETPTSPDIKQHCSRTTHLVDRTPLTMHVPITTRNGWC